MSSSEKLTGKSPFGDGKAAKRIYKILEKEIKPLS
jgi:UDP-N-acetylglucosamine 2-epimerase